MLKHLTMSCTCFRIRPALFLMFINDQPNSSNSLSRLNARTILASSLILTIKLIYENDEFRIKNRFKLVQC